MNRFIIAEPQNCIGCRTCEVACSMAHADSPGVTSLSSASFRPRLTVIVGAKISTPVLCRHCEDAPCANACPNDAIVYRQDSVQVLQERCVGCKSCVVACPFGAMQVVTVRTSTAANPLRGRATAARALKCDLCIDRVAGPACVATCPTKALHLVDNNTLEATLRQRQEHAALAASPLSL